MGNRRNRAREEIKLKKSIAIIIVSAVALILPQSIYAQEAVGENIKDELIDEYVKSIMDSFQIPGLSLAIVKDKKVFKANAYGFCFQTFYCNGYHATYGERENQPR